MQGTRTCTCQGGEYNCPMGGGSCMTGGNGGGGGSAAGAGGRGGAGGGAGRGGAGGGGGAAACVDGNDCTGNATCTQTCTAGGMQGTRTCTCQGGEYNCPMTGGSCMTGGGGGAGGAGGGGAAACVDGNDCTGTSTCTQTCTTAGGMQGTRTCTCQGGEYNCPMTGGSCMTGGGGGAGGAGGGGAAACADGNDCTGNATCTQTCSAGGMQGTRTCTCQGGEYNCPMGGGSCMTGDGGAGGGTP